MGLCTRVKGGLVMIVVDGSILTSAEILELWEKERLKAVELWDGCHDALRRDLEENWVPPRRESFRPVAEGVEQA